MVFHALLMYDAMNQRFLDPSRAKALFEKTGISVAEWARVQGFSTGLVYQILEGNRKCLRGQSHQIAVALGLKTGTAMELSKLSQLLKAGAVNSAKDAAIS